MVIQLYSWKFHRCYLSRFLAVVVTIVTMVLGMAEQPVSCRGGICKQTNTREKQESSACENGLSTSPSASKTNQRNYKLPLK